MYDVVSWIFLLLGVFGGFALSFIFWWWVNHRLVPSISFSEELSKRPIDYDKQRYRHQFAFKNTGARSIVNIRIKARLQIIDPRKRGSIIKNYFDVALSNNEVFELKPERMIRMAPMLHQSTALGSPILDERLGQALNNETLTLDDVFEIYPDALFYVEAIGTDIYSNATKVFQSKFYGRADVRLGIYKGRLLEITALEKPSIPSAAAEDAIVIDHSPPESVQKF